MKHIALSFALVPLLALSQPVWATEKTKPIQVKEAWAMPSLAGVKHGVAYVTLVNRSAHDDTLTRVSAPVAENVEIHTHDTHGDVMRMRELPSLALPAGETLAMKPGAEHIMLMSLKKPLKEGDSFPLKLKFAEAGEITVSVPVHNKHKNAAAPSSHQHTQPHATPQPSTDSHAHH